MLCIWGYGYVLAGGWVSLTRTPTLTLTLTLTLNQDERNLYLIEEFVQLGNLSTHIKKNHKLPNDTARFYAAQIVMAIQFLHSEHIIYRDLNPENVMLDRGHYVKLVDFGLAKGLNLDDPTARTWTLCGTPEYVAPEVISSKGHIYIYIYTCIYICIYIYIYRYVAPEVISSKGHSKEVDWWALGIVIFEMLAGYPPWYHTKPHTVYSDVINQRPDVPQHFDPHGKELIHKLLTKEVPALILHIHIHIHIHIHVHYYNIMIVLL